MIHSRCATEGNSGTISCAILGIRDEASLLCVFEKIQQEILRVLGGEKDALPTDSDLANLRYLDDVVHETLRLFPAVPINGRVCSETTTLPAGGGGTGEEPIPVPRGALIGFSRYACQRSTRYYGDDDEFPTRKVAGGQREGSNSRFHISSLYPDGGFQGHCTRMRGDRKDRSACRPAREAKCCSA